MAMHNHRNNRSIHTDQKRIAGNLRRHQELMTRFEAEGMGREEASALAFAVVVGKVAEPKAK